jgi:hypothetical protein
MIGLIEKAVISGTAVVMIVFIEALGRTWNSGH